MGNQPRSCGPILVVDEDNDCRMLVADLLRRAGFDVREAASGEEALEAVRRDPPILVLLDVLLPGTSGYGVCRALRSSLGWRVGILFVSGHRTESSDRVAGLLLGADDYLVKPFDPDELLARVEALLRRMLASSSTSGRLTKREFEVLALLAEGLDQAEIARRLVISPKTVGSHIEHILSKLGAHSRTQAVALAYRLELIGTAPGAYEPSIPSPA